MVERSIFEFDDYKDYLVVVLPTTGARRGGRSRLAKRLRCEPGRISQILTGNDHFSLDHGYSISEELNLNEKEREYFLNLLLEARSATRELKEYFQHKRKTMRKERDFVKSRVKATTPASNAVRDQYYSAPIFAAVHMACLSSKRQTPEKLATSLSLPISAVRDAIDFLLRAKFLKDESGQLKVGVSRIHLGDQNHHLKSHHTNWRLEAIRQIQFGRKEDFHYSSVMSLSSNTFEQIKDLLLKLIEESEPLIKASLDDQVAVMNLDLFEIGR